VITTQTGFDKEGYMLSREAEKALRALYAYALEKMGQVDLLTVRNALESMKDFWVAADEFNPSYYEEVES
jgi:hypothetical protein